MSVDAVKVDLALRLVEELGIGLKNLHEPPEVPTVAAYVPKVIGAASPSQAKTYSTYWRRAAASLGGMRLDRVHSTDILELQRRVAKDASRSPRATRDGRAAGENCVRAMRALFRMAVADGLIRGADNPAAAVPIPRRLPSARRALTAAELEEIGQVVLTTGKDVPLDSLLLRLHLETACRRAGALRLRLKDLDTDTSAVLLREKGGTVRWQPITHTLAAALSAHARERGVYRADDALLRQSDGRPMSSRRYDLIWKRVRAALPWARALGVSTHWLRHTTITWVERNFKYAVARAYAGHTDLRRGATLTYVKGQAREVATALAVMTGEMHPLAA